MPRIPCRALGEGKLLFDTLTSQLFGSAYKLRQQLSCKTLDPYMLNSFDILWFELRFFQRLLPRLEGGNYPGTCRALCRHFFQILIFEMFKRFLF